MKMFKNCIIFLFLFYFSDALAQEKFVVKGIIFHDENKQRLEQVNITNTNTTEKVLSDKWGTFGITASIGDTLIFEKERFRDMIKVVLAKQNLVIYLKPSVALDEVIVKSKTKAAEQKEILDAYHSKGVFYDGHPPFLAYIFTPLSALHELLGNDANNARNFSSYISRENAQSAVDRKFNKSLIMQHIPIAETDIAEFMYYYRPQPEQIKYWNDYDVIKYIKDSYKTYLKVQKAK